jgi:hypothetical protein
MTTTPSEPVPDDVPEADWAEQHVAAEPEVDELMAENSRVSHSVTTEANTADLAEQDTLAYVEDDEV